jgi:hypothetical protein
MSAGEESPRKGRGPAGRRRRPALLYVTFIGNEPIPPGDRREADCTHRGVVGPTLGPFRRVEVTDLQVFVEPAEGEQFVLARRWEPWGTWELQTGPFARAGVGIGPAWVYFRVSAAAPVGPGRHPLKRAG